MTNKIEVGSEWDFKGDKIKVVAISDHEVAFTYLNGRFDIEIIETWDKVCKPWQEKTLVSALLLWHEKLSDKLSDTRTGALRYFTYEEVNQLKDIILKAATALEKETRQAP